jgi:hypothetical protein
MAIYLFTSGTTWTIPAGVTDIQVECFGGAPFGYSTPFAGGSYAKTNSIAVTPGNTLRISISSSSGSGDSWATTVATGTPVVGATYTTSNSCLAKGGALASSSQVSSSIGNVKYAGGGINFYSGGVAGQGGQAGPNGPGGNGGASGNNWGKTLGAGGGANGGTAPQNLGNFNTPGYGRLGPTNPQGWGGYRDNTNPGLLYPPTQDVLGTTNFVNDVASVINYGPKGGSPTETNCCCSRLHRAIPGFIVITTASPSTTNTSNFFQFF